MARKTLGGSGSRFSRTNANGKKNTLDLANYDPKESLRTQLHNKLKDKMPDYQDILEEKMEKAMLEGGNKKYGGIAGTKKNEKAVKNNSFMKAYELISAKKKGKRKKAKHDIDIIAKPIANGRVKEDGEVVDASGNSVLKIDLNTGVIKNGRGMKVGKYNPQSATNDFILERLIQKHGQ